MFRLPLRTTLLLSALVVAGGIGMAWWMSAWPRFQDRGIEAAVAARRRETPRKPRVRHAHRAPRRVEVVSSSPHLLPSAQARPAPQPALPPAPPAPVHSPSPSYPIEALRANRDGVVTLRVSVDATGKVTAVTVATSSGHAAMDQAAVDAMRRWRFAAPATSRPMTFTYPMAFRVQAATP
ncbi:MAG TPA: energy transducer TonB [Rhodanobacteraceae bacterium]